MKNIPDRPMPEWMPRSSVRSATRRVTVASSRLVRRWVRGPWSVGVRPRPTVPSSHR